MINPILDNYECDLFIRKKALLDMLMHCKAYREVQLEVMGLMVGYRFNWNGRDFTVVEEVVTSELDTSAISVKFASFEPLFNELDKFEKEGKDYILVGWYHSHPGHTSFMSPTDKDTQMRMFNKPYQSAVVIDPINIEMKAFKLEQGDIYEKPYSIISGPEPERKLPRIVVPEEEVAAEVEYEFEMEIPDEAGIPEPVAPAAAAGEAYGGEFFISEEEMGEPPGEEQYEYDTAWEEPPVRTVHKIRRIVRIRTIKRRLRRDDYY